MTFTVLVCGGRDYADYEKVFNALSDLCDKRKLWSDNAYAVKIANGLRVVTGGARGADTMAEAWAQNNGAQSKVYPADWKQFGLRAGPVRNQQMIDEEKIDLVIGFPGGSGTRDMLSRARKAKICVQEVK